MAARTRISFATGNLYNINLPGLPIYADKDGWDQEQYNKKVQWSGGMIEKLFSDVWGFQEVWHRQALVDVFKSAGLINEYTILAPSDHVGQSIICAGAVRKDLLVGEPEWIVYFPDSFKLESNHNDDPQAADIAVALHAFSRPVLHFQVKPRKNGQVISVYVAHLKSKSPTRISREPWYRDNKLYYARHQTAIGAALSTIRRTAEATALRMILTEEMKNTDRPVVVLGDLNDAQLSNTLNIVTGQPNYILSGLNTGGSDTALYSTATLQEYRSLRDVYYTHIHQNIRESLDHILVSQEFYDNSRKRLWAFMGKDVCNDHLDDEEHKSAGTSDHGIVRAEFQYRPSK